MSRRRAFTLLEVTAALALFVLCAGVLLQAVANAKLALVTADAAHSRDADLRLIFQKILAAPDRAALTRDGKFTAPDGVVFRWSCELLPTPTTDLHKVVVKLRRDGDAEGAEKTFTLHALRPAWSTPEERDAILSRKKAAARPHSVS